MRRREVLAGIGGLGVLGVGAGLALGEVSLSAREGIEPVELRAVEAPGSSGGTITVPERGEVTFVELFATWCTVCEGMMPEVAAAHEAVGDEVQFVSVTNEPLGNTATAEDVAEWWDEHGGAWPVAHDADLALTEALDASGVPYAFVLDERNRVVWKHRGRGDAEELTAAVRDTLE